MHKQCCADQTAKTYLNTFRRILDDMVREMTSAALTDSISHNFIVQMIPHHRAAIDMSQNILQYTANKELQQIAESIVEEQTKSIENMRAILPRCSRCTNTKQELCAYQSEMERIMKTMFSNMRRACATDQLNCNFMWEMIPHHEGAVQMSGLTLRAVICPDLKPILNAIIASQQKGIAQMQHLLCRLGC